MVEEKKQSQNPTPPVSPVEQTPPVSPVSNPSNPRWQGLSLPKIVIAVILFLLFAGSAAGFYVLRQMNSKPYLLANYCTMKNGCPKDKCGIVTGCKEGTGLMPGATCLPEEKCVANGSYPHTSTLLGATWKTINFENLSFRIPQGWWSKNNEGNISEMQVNPTSLDQPHDWGSGITLKLFKNTSIDDQVNELKRSLAGEQKTFQQYNIKIDGKETIRVKSIYPNGFIGKDLNHENAYIQVGTDVYSILSDDVRFNSIEEQRVYFEQILSTFKFTDSNLTPTPDPTANWKLYSSGHISLHYPDWFSIYRQVPLETSWIMKDSTVPTLYLKNQNTQFVKPVKSSNPKKLGDIAAVDKVTQTIDGKLIEEYFIQVFNCGDCYSAHAYFDIDGTYYELSENIAGGGGQEQFDQMLATLKLTPLSASKSPDSNITPTPTCMPRPACLDATPRCMIAEPASGWCPK